MKADLLLHPFEPVINPDSQILILGSFPSIQSYRYGFYYGHPRNRFYAVLSALYHEDFVHVDIATKIHLLQKHHIALYDIIAACERKNSLDTSIKNAKPIDLAPILSFADIQAIGLNGAKTAQLYKRYFNHLACPVFFLPSTSPANAKFSLNHLIESWKIILNLNDKGVNHV